MSLTDVDKEGINRLTPTPNTSDNVHTRMAHNTMSNTYRSAAEPAKQRIAFKNSVILTYDGDNRVSSVYGYIPELADYPVFIIAKSGYDVYVDILGLDAPTV